MKTLALVALGSLGVLGSGAGLSAATDASPCELCAEVRGWFGGLFGGEASAQGVSCSLELGPPLTVCRTPDIAEVISGAGPVRFESRDDGLPDLEPFELPIYTSPLTAPVADRVEFRSAAVWAGACHYNGEYHHRGRAALLGFAFRSGEVNGVELAGLEAVVALGAEVNLDEAIERTAEAWVSERATPEQRAAVATWLEREVGALDAVHSGEVDVRAGEEAFGLTVAGVAEAAADTMADRACCSMPENRWYEPLAAEAGAPVGYVERCRFEGGAALGGWTYEGENSAFCTLTPQP